MTVLRRIDDPAAWDPAGNPIKTVAEVIIDECKVGMPGEMAAQYAGVSYRTFKTWLSEGRAVLRRVDDDPTLELSEREARSAQFAADIAAAHAFFVRNANVILENAARGRRRTTTKVVYNSVKQADGTVAHEEVERHVTTMEEPIELGPLQWRLSKIAPQVYGPAPRYEQESAEGESESIDIAKVVLEAMDRIAATVQVAPEEPGVE